MTALIIGLSPFVVSALTGLFKQLKTFTYLSDAARTPAVRLLAAAISLVYVFLGFWVSGVLDPSALGVAVQTLLFALLAWLGSLGVFHAWFQKA